MRPQYFAGQVCGIGENKFHGPDERCVLEQEAVNGCGGLSARTGRPEARVLRADTKVSNARDRALREASGCPAQVLCEPRNLHKGSRGAYSAAELSADDRLERRWRQAAQIRYKGNIGRRRS